MTNAEAILKEVTIKKENGELNAWEENFVSQFIGWNKKQLRNLSHKQYCKLRDIANK